ncbi:hypothetical protein CMO83_01460 [Candidatus Woesearchaeota archaeon]|jgi:hypothetical protein|nr:hypothetical protein [Candidatus Woesearchaeota archaeon]MDP6647980.1 hypothetical protein [Candidatus Woesearchaeota archaeon]|tara:strand:- start:20633 stop:20962 length:330 start_codon:yes stop_codon:yes gene_type:complete
MASAATAVAPPTVEVPPDFVRIEIPTSLPKPVSVDDVVHTNDNGILLHGRTGTVQIRGESYRVSLVYDDRYIGEFVRVSTDPKQRFIHLGNIVPYPGENIDELTERISF